MQDIIGDRRLKLDLPRNLVQLRDADKRPIATPRTREVGRMESSLRTINDAISSVDVRCEGGPSLTAPVARIFNLTTERGGRIYGIGASWQNLKRDLRQRVELDGEPVVELDYSTLHPAMLYAEAGASLPADCYALPGWDRGTVKFAMMVLINAMTESKARWKIASQCFAESEEVDLPALRRAGELIASIKDANRPIAHFFHSDAGSRLMRRDSDLAMQVLLDLERQGIVALPVHDSFLVPTSKRDALESAMLKAAHAIGLRDIRVAPAI